MSITAIGNPGDGVGPRNGVVEAVPDLHLDWEKIQRFYTFASASYGWWWYVLQVMVIQFSPAPC